MAYLRKKSGDNWYLIDKSGGKYRSVKLGHITCAEAKTVLAKYQLDDTYLRLNIQSDCDMTFKEIAAEYLQWAVQNKAHSTIQSEDYRLRLFVSALGNRQIKHLKMQDYEPLLVGKPHYRRLKINMLKAIYKFAIERKYLKVNIAQEFKAPRIPSTPPNFINENDVKKIFECMSPEALVKYKILYYTGLRPGEMLSLQVRDIDLVKKSILVRYSKTGRFRVIPMHEELIPIFKDLKVGKTKEAFLFPSRTNPNGHQVQIVTGLRRACKRAGVEGVSPYSFRHTFATRILEKTKDIRAAQQLLGHTSIQMTTRYATALDHRLKEAVDSI